MAENTVEKGDQVSWKWGASGRPSGEVAEVAKEGDLSVTSDKGNVIKKNANPGDPAVHIAREGNDVVKRAHEVDIEEKANGTAPAEADKAEEQAQEVKEPAPQSNGDTKTNGKAQVGEKREHEQTEKAKPEENGTAVADTTEEAEEDEGPAAKKQKTAEPAEKKDDDTKKGRGRPKKGETNGTAKAPAKKKQPKPAATVDGKPRRSARIRS